MTNPAVLSGVAGIMEQVATQQSMVQISDYLATIDEKVDDILRKQDDVVVAQMVGIGSTIDRAMTIREEMGGVNETRWSTVIQAHVTKGATQSSGLWEGCDFLRGVKSHLKQNSWQKTAQFCEPRLAAGPSSEINFLTTPRESVLVWGQEPRRRMEFVSLRPCISRVLSRMRWIDSTQFRRSWRAPRSGLAKTAKHAESGVPQLLAVLALCFQMEDEIDVIDEIDRVLARTPEGVVTYNRGMRKARKGRRELISGHTTSLLDRMDAAVGAANAKMVWNRAKPLDVVASANHLASGFHDFHGLLRIESDPRSWEERRLGPAAEMGSQVIQKTKDTAPTVAAGVTVLRLIGVARKKLQEEGTTEEG